MLYTNMLESCVILVHCMVKVVVTKYVNICVDIVPTTLRTNTTIS